MAKKKIKDLKIGDSVYRVTHTSIRQHFVEALNGKYYAIELNNRGNSEVVKDYFNSIKNNTDFKGENSYCHYYVNQSDAIRAVKDNISKAIQDKLAKIAEVSKEINELTEELNSY